MNESTSESSSESESKSVEAKVRMGSSRDQDHMHHDYILTGLGVQHVDALQKNTYLQCDANVSAFITLVVIDYNAFSISKPNLSNTRI